jgi:hypothetical protein
VFQRFQGNDPCVCFAEYNGVEGSFLVEAEKSFGLFRFNEIGLDSSLAKELVDPFFVGIDVIIIDTDD